MKEIRISFNENESEDVRVEFGHSVTKNELVSAMEILQNAIQARKDLMKIWIPVSSSVISDVRYHPMGKGGEFSCVEITMNNDNNYIYFGVPFETFQSMINSESKGSFYNKHIKGRFPCTRLD